MTDTGTDTACTDSGDVASLLAQVEGSLDERQVIRGCLALSAWGGTSHEVASYRATEARRASRLPSPIRPDECTAPGPTNSIQRTYSQ